MALELIVNLLLLGFSIFCYFYVGATMPVSAANELGAEQWPQALLLLLIPVIGWLVILIFNCQRGTEGNNRFGPDPKPFSY